MPVMALEEAATVLAGARHLVGETRNSESDLYLDPADGEGEGELIMTACTMVIVMVEAVVSIARSLEKLAHPMLVHTQVVNPSG